MKRSVKLTALCLCGWLLCAPLWGCQSDPAPVQDSSEPAPSTGSQPYTPEDVFRKLTGADDVKVSVIYTETESNGAERVNESAVLEKDGQLVKVSLKDNDEENLYYYDLDAALGYQQKEDGKWESVTVAETVPDWLACLQQAFSISGMNSRLSWLFASDTYEPYDPQTGKCVMKTEEMTQYFGESWSKMTAYLMQSGDTYYVYLSTSDDLGTFTYKLVMEYVDTDVKLPK